jgi:hypothetical protein
MHFQDFIKGKRVSAARLNEQKDLLEKLSVFGDGELGDDGGTGAMPPYVRPIARITGILLPPQGSGQLYQYSYQIVGFSNTPIYSPLYWDVTDANGVGFTGGPATMPAYERSNIATVPVDGSAIVELDFGPNSSYIFSWPFEVVLAMLEGDEGDAQYAWTEVYHGPGGTFPPVADGRNGTTTDNFAKERDNVTGIRPGTIVKLERGFCSGYDPATFPDSDQEWNFGYCCGLPGSSISHSLESSSGPSSGSGSAPSSGSGQSLSQGASGSGPSGGSLSQSKSACPKVRFLRDATWDPVLCRFDKEFGYMYLGDDGCLHDSDTP